MAKPDNNTEWLFNIHRDLQMKIKNRKRSRKPRRREPASYPSVKDLYSAAIMIEDY